MSNTLSRTWRIAGVDENVGDGRHFLKFHKALRIILAAGAPLCYAIGRLKRYERRSNDKGEMMACFVFDLL